MTLAITPIYAALLTLLLIVLSARVVRQRLKIRVSVGDAGDKALMQRMRVQANWVEYAPIGLLLLLIAELQGAPALALHLLGGGLTLGRILHAIGMSRHPQILPLRQLGMALTLLALALAALGFLGHAIF